MNSIRLFNSAPLQSVQFGQNNAKDRINKINALPTVLGQCGISMTNPDLGIGFGQEQHILTLTAPSETGLFAVRLQLANNPETFQALESGNFIWKGQFLNTKPVELELNVSQPTEGFCGGIGNGIY
jgi:hypothetical protein